MRRIENTHNIRQNRNLYSKLDQKYPKSNKSQYMGELIMKIFGVELNWDALKDEIWNFGNKPSSWTAPETPENGVTDIERNEDTYEADRHYEEPKQGE